MPKIKKPKNPYVDQLKAKIVGLEHRIDIQNEQITKLEKENKALKEGK